MFHWICPECGREIPPAMKECSACDPAAAPVETPVAASVAASAAIAAPVVEPAPVAPAPALAIAPAPEPEALPDPLLALAEQLRAVHAQADEPPAAPQPDPVTPAAGLTELASAVGLAEVPAAPTPAAAEVAAAPAQPVETSPAAQPATQTVTQSALAAAAQPIALLAPPEPAPAATQQPEPQPIEASQALALVHSEPVPEQIPLPQAAPAQPEPVAQPVAESVAAPPPLPEPVLQPEPQAAAAPIQVVPESPAPVAAAAQAPAPQAAATALPESAPAATTLDQPPSGSWLQLAPLQNYTSAATRAMQPAAPPAQILAPDSGPKMTLPGPSLPPKLERLQEANIVTVIGDQSRSKRSGMPGWLISLLLMIGIPIAGAALLFYFQPVAHSSADAKAAAAPQETPVAAQPQVASHPLSQLVEVTGFRIVVDFNKKSEIHYLVVNHSATDLSDMTIFVTLRPADSKPGQPPLCRFSFRAPALGPFESKEMTSPIEKLARPVSMPEWQDLRSEIQIAQ